MCHTKSLSILEIIVEKPINMTGNKAVNILFVKLGSSEISKDFEAINSFFQTFE